MNLLNFDSVLLDMDGTLLDGHFDDLFWNDWVAKAYAAKNGLALDHARQQVQSELHAVAGQIAWYDFDRWADRFGLDLESLQESGQVPHPVSTGDPCFNGLPNRPQHANDPSNQCPPQSVSL